MKNKKTIFFLLLSITLNIYLLDSMSGLTRAIYIYNKINDFIDATQKLPKNITDLGEEFVLDNKVYWSYCPYWSGNIPGYGSCYYDQDNYGVRVSVRTYFSTYELQIRINQGSYFYNYCISC